MRSDSSGHPESVNYCLAEFLSARKESICEAWSKRIGNDPLLRDRASMALPRGVAEILTQLEERLHHSSSQFNEGDSTKGDATVLDVPAHSNICDALRGFQHLRSDLLYHLRTFEDVHPEYGMAAMHFVTHLVHHFLDELMIEAVKQSPAASPGRSY